MFYRRSTLVLLLALIFLSFFGILSLSAWMFPDNYDWRYRVISSLLSPRDNPRHYWLAASGVALTAVLMFRSVDVVWVLVRMEWPRSKLDRHYRVLDLVTRDPDATDRIIRQ
jgi:hypothetical protein